MGEVVYVDFGDDYEDFEGVIAVEGERMVFDLTKPDKRCDLMEQIIVINEQLDFILDRLETLIEESE